MIWRHGAFGAGYLFLALVYLALGPEKGEAFYLPGLAPVNFCPVGGESTGCKVCAPPCPCVHKFDVLHLTLHEKLGGKPFQSSIGLYVNRLDSDQSVIPFEYHQ